MSTIVYPPCRRDDIRKKPNDFTNPLNQKNIRVTDGQKVADENLLKRGECVCKACRDGRVIIAKNNKFDNVAAEY